VEVVFKKLSMEQMTIIPKNKTLSVAEDYELLRKTGREYIENLGSELWTDYNEHDPGITILEALCYAITELGYRTNIDIADLLTGTDGKISADQPFYTAREILTCSSLTINDYRKLLADIIGVHNAWLYADDRDVLSNGQQLPINEVPLYADCKKDILTPDKTAHPLFISGLFRVLLDLDNDDQFGDLNKGDIEIFNPVSTGATPKFRAGEISFTMELPHIADVDIELVKAAAEEAHITLVEVNQEDAKWKSTVTTDTGLPPFTFVVTINIKPAGKKIELADLQDFFTPKYVSQVFYEYGMKLEKIKAILLLAKKTLHANRNLCEDFIKIETVRDEEVAICCDIDVRPDTDMEAVQAEAFYVIENYLNPSINFYLLKELMAKGTAVDEIFLGPKLNHGFIDTAELEATQLRDVIHTSDIINLLMDIPGVLSVRNFMLTKYDDIGNTIPGQVGLKWCMHINPRHKPVLSINRSKIIFYKNNFPFLATYAEIRDSLKLMRANRERPKLKGQQDDLLIPLGTFRQLDEYWSIQNDLPQTYGVGQAGLPLTATPLRKAQAKQLKAYLLFYDQLLGDFFSQLQHSKNLFGLDDLKQTYFSQFLAEIPDIAPVFKQMPPGNALLKDVFLDQDSTLASVNKEWKALVETDTLFKDRRNRFLDHLLARFAESFNEYVLMMFSLNYQDRTAESISSEKLISNKIDFLKEYPVLSYARGTAFNYFPLTPTNDIDDTKLWDTDNVSGLEKRASKLAGIKNYLRRFLSCVKNIEIKTIKEKVIQEDSTELVKTYYEFVLQNMRGDKLVQSEKFDSKADLEKVIEELLELLDDKPNYLYDSKANKIEIIGADNKVLARTAGDYNTKSSAEKAIKQFVFEFSEACPDAEGMLLIEHLLLRPRTSDYKLMHVCLDKDCEFCGEEDPYTYRASVFLPYWTEQFNNMNFRSYFENMIRTEAPAHIMLKVCWISNEQMCQLELDYKRWINALAYYTHTPLDVDRGIELKEANDNLVLLLATLHSVYPEATLHDCDESVNTNPVMLGKTILGTLKPKKP
jgi:hypothetical protein